MTEVRIKPTLLFIWFDPRSVTIYLERFKVFKDFNLILITSSLDNSYSKKNINGINVIFLPIILRLNVVTFYMKYLHRYLKQIDYDYIYLHDEPWNFTSFVVSLHCFFNKKKFTLDCAVTRKRDFSLSFFFKIPFEFFVLRIVNFVYVRNHDVYNALVSRGHGNILKNKHEILPIGVELKKFYPIKKINKKNLLFVGRIFKDKGVFDLLNLSKKYNEKITFVGDFLNEEFKSVFFDYVKKHNLQNNIKYIKNVNDIKTLNQIYNNHFITILPSHITKNWTEQFGRVLVESISAGTVAIGSNIGFIPNIVGHDMTFNFGNVDEIYKLVNFLKNQSNYKKILNDQIKGINKYSYKAVYKKVKKHINDSI